MKTYREFANNLITLLGDAKALRIKSGSYMPLSIEDIGTAGEGQRLISLCHYGEQNGDLMRDPDMVFMLHEHRYPGITDGVTYFAEPVSFRNDYMGILQEVYEYNEAGARTHVRPKLKAELKSFATMWFKNLREQGFFSPEAQRERLA